MVEEKLAQQICNVLEKSYETFYYIVFLEVCKPYGITPIGFNIKKTPCVGKPSKSFLLLWWKKLAAAHFKLIELTINESSQKLCDLETEFISKFSLYTYKKIGSWKQKITWKNMKRNSAWKNSRKLECCRVLMIYIFHVWNVLRVITNFFV